MIPQVDNVPEWRLFSKFSPLKLFCFLNIPHRVRNESTFVYLFELMLHGNYEKFSVRRYRVYASGATVWFGGLTGLSHLPCKRGGSMPSWIFSPITIPTCSQGFSNCFVWLNVFTYSVLATNIFSTNLLQTLEYFPDMSANRLSVKNRALVLALVIVPIVVLCCILAVAIACSEYWSSRGSGRPRRRWYRCISLKNSSNNPRAGPQEGSKHLSRIAAEGISTSTQGIVFPDHSVQY